MNNKQLKELLIEYSKVKKKHPKYMRELRKESEFMKTATNFRGALSLALMKGDIKRR